MPMWEPGGRGAAFNRAGADQGQVATLKDKAYQQAADDMSRMYAP